MLYVTIYLTALPGPEQPVHAEQHGVHEDPDYGLPGPDGIPRRAGALRSALRKWTRSTQNP